MHCTVGDDVFPHMYLASHLAQIICHYLRLYVCPFFVSQFGRTEMILNCLNPKFAKKFVIDYYFEMVQRLKFCVYDIDNNTYDLGDDDFLGELECTLGQVSFHFATSLKENLLRLVAVL